MGRGPHTQQLWNIMHELQDEAIHARDEAAFAQRSAWHAATVESYARARTEELSRVTLRERVSHALEHEYETANPLVHIVLHTVLAPLKALTFDRPSRAIAGLTAAAGFALAPYALPALPALLGAGILVDGVGALRAHPGTERCFRQLAEYQTELELDLYILRLQYSRRQNL